MLLIRLELWPGHEMLNTATPKLSRVDGLVWACGRCGATLGHPSQGHDCAVVVRRVAAKIVERE